MTKKTTRINPGVALDTSNEDTLALCRMDDCTWRELFADRDTAFMEWQWHAQDWHDRIKPERLNKMPVWQVA